MKADIQPGIAHIVVEIFDTFAQIIEGNAEIVIDSKAHLLATGQGIVIPAHRSNIVNAKERFKMILTVIKSGFEN